MERNAKVRRFEGPLKCMSVLVAFVSVHSRLRVCVGCMRGERRRQFVHHPHPDTHTRPTKSLMHARVTSFSTNLTRFFFFCQTCYTRTRTHTFGLHCLRYVSLPDGNKVLRQYLYICTSKARQYLYFGTCLKPITTPAFQC